MAPQGNFNAQRISLCNKRKCRRQRKTELQRAQRRQKMLALPFAKFPKPKPNPKKRKFFGQTIE